jgi:hypothetical protein
MLDQDTIVNELTEIEHMLLNEGLSEDVRFALMGASQVLWHVLDPETWQSASHTFYRLDARPDEVPSPRRH